MDITIAQATLEDLPALAEVNRSSYSDEAASRFAHKNWRDEKHMYEFFKGRLSGRFNDEATQVLKAVDRDTDKIVGFACFTLETGNETGPTPTAMMAQKMPPSMNKDFIVAAGTEMENLREHMRGEKHYCKLPPQPLDCRHRLTMDRPLYFCRCVRVPGTGYWLAATPILP